MRYLRQFYILLIINSSILLFNINDIFGIKMQDMVNEYVNKTLKPEEIAYLNNVKINGNNVDILYFNTRKETNVVKELYVTIFKRKGIKVMDKVKASDVLSGINNKNLFTLTVIRNDRLKITHTFLSITNLRINASKNLNNFIPIPKNTWVIYEIESSEMNSKSKMLLIKNFDEIKFNRDFFSLKLKDLGWRQVGENNSSAGDTEILFFEKTREFLFINFNRKNGENETYIFINHITEN